MPVYTERRSRGSTNRADHGPESANTDYDLIWLYATHSAIGGAAWNGDNPAGAHGDLNDRATAAESDQHVRNKARSKKHPLNLVDDYG